MREGAVTALVILVWLAASAAWYFWAAQSIWGFLVGIVVLVGIPAWAFSR